MIPETCPFCGAEAHGMSGTWVTFRCHTMTQTVADHRQFQSRTCEKAERARLVVRVAELEVENKTLRDRFSDADTERNAAQAALKAAFARLAELEARCKRLEEAARAVYLDSIASDHPWTELETCNMHALRDVLEAKP